MRHLRPLLLVSTLVAVLLLAWWQDRPAPAWGASQLPDLLLFAVVCVGLVGGAVVLVRSLRR